MMLNYCDNKLNNVLSMCFILIIIQQQNNIITVITSLQGLIWEYQKVSLEGSLALYRGCLFVSCQFCQQFLRRGKRR